MSGEKFIEKINVQVYDIDEFRAYSTKSGRTLYLCSDSNGLVVRDNNIKLIGNIFKIQSEMRIFMNSYVADIYKTLKENTNIDNARKMEAYMKNLFPFMGINMPMRKSLTKKYMKQSKEIDIKSLLSIMYELYDCEEREFQYVAIDLLGENYIRFSYEDFKMLYLLINKKPWWDSIDALRKQMALWVKNNLQYFDEIMTTLLDSSSFWNRRIALNIQLLWKNDTNTEWLKKAILQNIDDEEFFIQKAIGWALRDYSKTNAEWVKELLNTYSFSNLAYKEGSKYL
ncbi:DNA alkylation repair protein [Tissierella sp. MSJ-40]|uniref:DNA alkylation repair protein n=1 Tax=Tissierella simiarum TaxID=2841534 RepID=A0ABS6E3G3_9FIRM|nr:DNA alkylation repair protein [Tissierella simiarum]MBU5437366.1 DNA alkylation repair protein [Tissierella simiarum]